MIPQLHLHVLASGSKGNATVVEGPEGSVLVDCGLSRRELFRRADELGVDMGRVRALVLTHEHADHVSGVSVFCNRFDGELYATAGTVAARKYLAERQFCVVRDEDEFEVAGIRVRTFPTSHDVADPIGLRFECGGDAIGYCTDTGRLTPQAIDALRDVRVLALESNHDAHMLATGPYPRFLKVRVAGAGGHLSNGQAAEALEQLVGPHTQVVVGMHLSEKNNRPSVCVRTLAAAVGAEATNSTFTEAATPDGRLFVCVAGQDRPMTVW